MKDEVKNNSKMRTLKEKAYGVILKKSGEKGQKTKQIRLNEEHICLNTLI